MHSIHITVEILPNPLLPFAGRVSLYPRKVELDGGSLAPCVPAR